MGTVMRGWSDGRVGRLAAFGHVAGGGEGRLFVAESDPFPHILVLEVTTGG